VSELLSGRLTRRADVAAGASVVLRWADLEPAGAELAPVVTAAIRRLSLTARIRLTIRGGPDAPAWLRERTGSVPIVDPGSERLIGRSAAWWHPEYVAAWASLHARLGAALDADDRVAEVTLGCPLAGTGDPFARWARLELNRAAYVQAGWDARADWDATTDMIQRQAAAWPTTTQVLWVASCEAMTLGGVRSHMEPVLSLAESVAGATGERLLLGAARRLTPSPEFGGALARLAAATGPRAAVSAYAGGGDDWAAIYNSAGVALTSLEAP